MRTLALSGFLVLAVLLPARGSAQLTIQPVTPPVVTAADAPWQIAGDPLLYDGDVYYPTGPTVFFDGNVMARTGVYKDIPLYQDRTLEPYSLVYVPVGGNLMRPYERRRTGELANTTGSRTPSFPVESDEHAVEPAVTSEVEPSVGTSATRAAAARPALPPAAHELTSIESIPPPPRGASGVWIEFGGGKWYLAGPTAAYASGRFVPIGTYHGFIVYRDTSGSRDRVWVPVVAGGPLAPYSKR